MTVKRVLLILLVTAAVPAARAACSVDQVTTVPLGPSASAVTVPVEVNGITATFLLDTGASRSVVTGDAVRRLGLARDPWVGTTMSGIGGIDRRPNADPRSLSLGGVKLARQTLNHDTSLTVATIPRADAGGQVIDGLLGRDFLSVFDLDLDFPGRRLALYRVNGCAGRFLPWQTGYTQVPVSVPAEQAMIVAVRLDGTALRALLDTGSGASVVAAPGMARLGLQPSTLSSDAADTANGLGPRAVVMHRHGFRSLQVGEATTVSPSLWVAPVRLPLFADMVLGMDWLSRRRVWISYATAQIFVAAP